MQPHQSDQTSQINSDTPINLHARPTIGLLEPDALRWICPESEFTFETTDDIEPLAGVIGQETAVEALEFGLETNAPGQNIFVRGLSGTGKITLLKRLLNEIKPVCDQANDLCYIHNFDHPDRPRVLTLPPGTGKRFRRAIDQFADFIRDSLGDVLNSEQLVTRGNALEKRLNAQIEAIVKPFDEELRASGLALVTVNMGGNSGDGGGGTHTTIFPLVDGKPMPPEEFAQLNQEGKVPEGEYDSFIDKRKEASERFEELTIQINKIRDQFRETAVSLLNDEIQTLLATHTKPIRNEFPSKNVAAFLDSIVDDITNNRISELREGVDFTRQYRVNVILDHSEVRDCPIIIENAPTMRNLLGSIDREMVSEDRVYSDHMTIKSGAILQADGGYLILDARELLAEPGAWKVLKRTLRSGKLDIVPTEMNYPMWGGPTIKPEPIDVKVKVILLGDAEIYHTLDAYEPDFPELFKLLADFNSTIDRCTSGIQQYASVLARLSKEENLRPFHRSAVGALAEHGSRIASSSHKLTTRFGRLSDLAREASFIAGKASQKVVAGAHVYDAILRSKKRANLPSRNFREYITDGTIQIQTQGSAVGQINGLAVLQSGPLTYGFPARITATIGPGTAGVINIEREASLSGSIHTKGFYILGGLLRTLLRTDHPLAFSASIAFEQSYGGIDGDSASGAEICCLLSALTQLPIRQDFAMTGAIDQTGNILAIGGANEKIEGYFDVCKEIGLTGTQGVIIPESNAGSLMLRPDVVTACRDGQFSIHTVKTVHDAIEILTGRPAGQRDEHGNYPDNSLLSVAVKQAREYWIKALHTLPTPPDRTSAQIEDTGSEDETPSPLPR